MRHRIAKQKLNRDTEHRTALARNMADSLVQYEKIETTLPKAKFLQSYIERLITKAKNIDQNNKLQKFNTINAIQRKMFDKEAVRKLVDDVAPRFTSRQGGYTRIVRTRIRSGDKALMVRIEFTEAKKAKPTKKVGQERLKANEK